MEATELTTWGFTFCKVCDTVTTCSDEKQCGPKLQKNEELPFRCWIGIIVMLTYLFPKVMFKLKL